MGLFDWMTGNSSEQENTYVSGDVSSGGVSNSDSINDETTYTISTEVDGGHGQGNGTSGPEIGVEYSQNTVDGNTRITDISCDGESLPIHEEGNNLEDAVSAAKDLSVNGRDSFENGEEISPEIVTTIVGACNGEDVEYKPDHGEEYINAGVDSIDTGSSVTEDTIVTTQHTEEADNLGEDDYLRGTGHSGPDIIVETSTEHETEITEIRCENLPVAGGDNLQVNETITLSESALAEVSGAGSTLRDAGTEGNDVSSEEHDAAIGSIVASCKAEQQEMSL